MTTNPEIISLRVGSVSQNQINKRDLNINMNAIVSTGAKNEMGKTDYITKRSIEVDIDMEIKKQSQQLRRNLKTLHYISILEARPDMIKDLERREEIKNLKKSIQRTIIRNTRLLNNCRLSN